MHKQSTLILGGARSGKSTFGEQLALGTGLRPVYIATAEALDDEMQQRVKKHQKARAGKPWLTVEEPLSLPHAITSNAGPDRVILVDCITLWLSNLLAAERSIAEESERLVEAITKASCPVILISNEVGMGIVPMNALARSFRDEAGWLNQKLAAALPNCNFIIAGLPLPLKKDGKTQIESVPQ